MTNATNLMGGRVVAEVGDFVEVGATLVNAHNSQTFEDAFERNPLKGAPWLPTRGRSRFAAWPLF